MYCIEVYHKGQDLPDSREAALSAGEVMSRMRATLREQGDCERIVVYANSRELFAVDSAGNRIEAQKRGPTARATSAKHP